MSISSQLLILNQTKENIKQAINLKGVSVTNEAFSEYPDKVRQIPSGSGTYESNVILFLEGRLKDLVVPSGTETIRDYAYTDSEMVTLTIPSSVRTIGKSAFCCNWSLTSVTIANGVTTIGDYAFSTCTNLHELIFPDSVTTIGAYCGDYVPANIEIGTGIQSIGDSAFANVWGKTICIKATVPPTINNSFSEQDDIYVPDDSVLAYQTATGWQKYSSRIKGISEKPQ